MSELIIGKTKKQKQKQKKIRHCKIVVKECGLIDFAVGLWFVFSNYYLKPLQFWSLI